MPTGREVDKLRIKDGDIVVIRMPKSMLTQDGYEESAKLIRNHLYAQGIEDVLIMVLAPDTALSLLDEAEMKHYGWVREVEDDEEE